MHFAPPFHPDALRQVSLSQVTFEARALIISRINLTHALQKTRLLSFKEQAHHFASILDPHASPKLDPDSELTLWSMVDYGTMCSDDQLIMPARSESALPAEREETRNTPSASLAVDIGGEAPNDMYMPSSDQFHPDEMIFDGLDVRSLDYLLDLPPGGEQV